MEQIPVLGQIVILNGTPRSGKSSIAAAIQASFDGVWMNLGVAIASPYRAYQFREQHAKRLSFRG